MNTQDYLLRIGFEDKADLSIETLRALQITHMKAVPFENLDISLGRKIQLDQESLWDKIIIRRRGGFCYELNGMFAWLLKQLGFDVTYLNARVYSERDRTLGIEFDHLALLVKTPNSSIHWLADVGFGDSFIQPLDMDNVNWQVQGLRAYRLEPFQNGYQLWQKGYGGEAERQYYFDRTAHNFPLEYEAACVYHQTSPDSIFTKKRIISRATNIDSRITLNDNELIVTSEGKQVRSAVTEKERTSLLKEHFGVVL
ncbi:MAG: arylamine N-acetyltransferase [Anaerolineales bacterium]